MKQSKLTYCVLLALASTTATAAEQNDQTNINYFDTVVVTASKTAQRLGDVDGTITVIGQDEMQRNVVQSVDDVFRYNPSISATSTTTGTRNASGNANFNIRGMTQNRIRVSVDGVEQAKDFDYAHTSNTERPSAAVDFLKQVEVVPISASTTHGSDALGGVIEYTTIDPSDIHKKKGNGVSGRIRTSHNSANEGLTTSASFAGRSGRIESLLAISKSDSSETKNQNHDKTPNSPSNHQRTDILAKVKVNLADQRYLKFTAEHSKKEDDFSEENSPWYSKSVFDDKQNRQRFSAEYTTQTKRTAFDKATLKADWQKTESDQTWEYQASFGANNIRGTYDEKQTQLSTNLDKTIKRGKTNHKISYGASTGTKTYTQHKKSLTQDFRVMPKSEEQKIAIYAQDSITTGKLTVTPGIRYDHYKITPKPDALSDAAGSPITLTKAHENSQVSFKLGTTYDINDQHSVFGQWAQGFKSPDVKQLYENRQYPHGLSTYRHEPNPDLTPETSDSLEIGYRYETDKSQWEVVAFQTKHDDFIVREDKGTDANGIKVKRHENIDSVTTRGLEVKGAYQATPTTKLKASVAYAKGTQKDDGVSKAFNEVSPLKGTIGAAYTAPSKNWGADIHLTAAKGKAKGDVSKSDPREPDPFLAAGYTTVDVTAHRKISKNGRIDVGVFNVGDKQYWTWDNARNLNSTDSNESLLRSSEAGRHVKAALTWNF